MGRPLVGALVSGGPDRLGRLEFDELLQDKRHRLAHDIDTAAGADGVEQLGQGRLWKGHRCLLVILGRNTPRITPVALPVPAQPVSGASLKSHHSGGHSWGMRLVVCPAFRGVGILDIMLLSR
jgi:hypothetical protein